MLINILESNTNKFNKNIWILFIIVFFTNLLLKITCIDFSPFWYDEIISVQSASLNFGHIKHVSEWDRNPPFYYYCLRVWIKLFNNSEFTVRLLSAIFSSLSAGLVFVIANRLFNKTTSIIASLLFISNNVLFYYSHEARAYSLVLLLGLVSTFLYFNLKNKASVCNFILLGIFNFLIIYTHYIAGLILLVEFILALIYFESKQKKQFLLSCLIVLGLVLLRFTKKQWQVIIGANSSEQVFWLSTSKFNYLVEVITNFLFNPAFASIALLIIVFAFSFIVIKKHKAVNFPFLYCLILGLGSIVFLYFIGKFTPIFLGRYLIFTIPFLYIVIGFGLSFFKMPVIPISVIALCSMFFITNINFKTNKKMDYNGTTQFIKLFKQKADLVIVKTKDIKPLFCYYYDKNFFTQQKTDLPTTENIIFCNSWADIGDINVDNFDRVIVVDSYEQYNIKNEKEFVTNLSLLKKPITTLNSYEGVKISFYK